MSSLATTGAASPDLHLGWSEVAASTWSGATHPKRENDPLVYTTQWMAHQDISETDLKNVERILEGVVAATLILEHHSQQRIEYITGSFQSTVPTEGRILERQSQDMIEYIIKSFQRESTAPTEGRHIADTDAIWLEDALADLRAAPDEAKDEHLPTPSDKALQNGEHVLREMYRIWPRRFEVYPMPNGEIAIDAPAGPGRSVIVLCDSEGGALCAVNFDRTHRRARYSDARMLPDGFLRDAIRDMTTNA